MEMILEFFKAAIAALLKLLGVEVDEKPVEDFVDNVQSGVNDVVDFGNSIA